MLAHLDINIKSMRQIVLVMTCFYLQTQDHFDQRFSQNTVSHENAIGGKQHPCNDCGKKFPLGNNMCALNDN